MPRDVAQLELPPFRSRFRFLSGDRHTIAFRWRMADTALPPLPQERISLALRDGSGDTLLGLLDRAAEPQRRPLLVLVHGLTGSEDSIYMRNTASHFNGLGYNVLRLNLRGAGPSRPLCGGQYHAGSSGDLRAALRLLPPKLLVDGVAAIGFSLGGAILLKYLGEAGLGTPVVAAATVCAPVDLVSTCRQLLRARTRLYQGYFLANMKREALAEGARLTEAERDAIRRARSVREFDDLFIAPRHGYEGVDHYYAENTPMRFLEGIAAPTLCIAAKDDPCVPVATYSDLQRAASRAVRVAVADGGGHIGFHDASTTVPWHDRAIASFFERMS
jgi:predicted alpha/beta-fold hydrolase